MSMRDYHPGQACKVFGPMIDMDTHEPVGGQKSFWFGKIDSYMGDDEFIVTIDEMRGYYRVPRDQIIPDTPEYRLGELVWGDGDTIRIPDYPERPKQAKDWEGRVPSDITKTLMALIFTPQVRATLECIDPNIVSQSMTVLRREGWVEGDPFPQEVLSTKETATIALAQILNGARSEFEFWAGVRDNPESHPHYDVLRTLNQHSLRLYADQECRRHDDFMQMLYAFAQTLGIPQFSVMEAAASLSEQEG